MKWIESCTTVNINKKHKSTSYGYENNDPCVSFSKKNGTPLVKKIARLQCTFETQNFLSKVTVREIYLTERVLVSIEHRYID